MLGRDMLIGWMAPGSELHATLAAPLLIVCAMAQPFFATVTRKEIADAHAVTETLLALSLDSRAEVDALAAKALAAGAREYAEPRDHGFMYQRAIADLDGHQWELFWMDEAGMPG